MKHVIQCNVTLLRDRSVNCLLVCSLYAVAKLAKVELTFKQILDVFSRLFPEGIGRVTYHVSMSVEGAPETKKGSIIDFYNKVFVVSNNDYLVSIKRNIHYDSLISLFHTCFELTSTVDTETPSVNNVTAKPVSLQESIIEEARQTVDSMREGVDTSQSSSVAMTVTSHVDAHSSIPQGDQRNASGRPQVAAEHRGAGEGHVGKPLDHVSQPVVPSHVSRSVVSGRAAGTGDAAGNRPIPADSLLQSCDESDDWNERAEDVQQHRDGVQVRTGERSETERLSE